MNLTKFKRSVAVLQSELSLHAIIDKYAISSRTLTSHNTEESENSRSPHIKCMRKQCVPGTPPFFACPGDEASPTLADYNAKCMCVYVCMSACGHILKI